MSIIPLPFTLLFWVWVYTPFLCFLSREVLLAFVEELVWWRWILSAFACLLRFQFFLHIWMRSLLDIVIWIVSFSLSSLQVHPAIPFWPEEFLWKDQPLSLLESTCVLFFAVLLLLLIFTICVWSSLIWLICVLGCFTLGLSCLGLSGFLGLGRLFPSPF